MGFSAVGNTGPGRRADPVAMGPVGAGYVAFRIAGDVARAVAIAAGSRVEISLGEGSDNGLVMIRPGCGDRGWTPYLTGKRATALRLAMPGEVRALLSEPPSRTTGLAYRVEGGALIVDLRPFIDRRDT